MADMDDLAAHVGGWLALWSEAIQPLKSGEGSAKSAAFPKLRTPARKKCEHALVELGGIEPPSVEG